MYVCSIPQFFLLASQVLFLVGVIDSGSCQVGFPFCVEKIVENDVVRYVFILCAKLSSEFKNRLTLSMHCLVLDIDFARGKKTCGDR